MPETAHFCFVHPWPGAGTPAAGPKTTGGHDAVGMVPAATVLVFWKRSCYAKAMGVRMFVKVNRVENERRWYVVTWGPTLFETWAVVCTWGRLGTDWSQRQVQEFETQEEAVAKATAQMQRREKRGYTAVAW